MITDADVQKLKKTFATKADLTGFVTKDDLIKKTERIIEAMTDILEPKANTDDLNQQQRQIDNHEDRILTLENSIN